MNKDIRVAVSLTSHPKAILLMRKLGPEAFYNLIRLWTYTAMNKPDGKFTGDAEDVCDEIEIGAGWSGTPGTFFQTLQGKKTRFLDKIDGGFELHDWEEHNEYVTHAKKRSERAKIGASARWKNRDAVSGKDTENPSPESENLNSKTGDQQVTSKRPTSDQQVTSKRPTSDQQCDQQCDLDATRMQPACNPHCDPHQTRYAPSPSPSPSPSPKNKNNPGETPGNVSDSEKDVKPKKLTEGAEAYFRNINQACRAICKLPRKRRMFNPYKWAQEQISKNRHPGAIGESLEGLIKFWDTTGTPWSYATSILTTKNGNWNEAEAIQIHETLKNLKPGILEELIHGLFDDH
ncbi:MAG: hypothetical protein JEZ12_28225 [Desulfobacterium sp.]|nr:hypothetical protein [Desulfobacterium sp.]